ncbi:hypothetical protein FA13DRAFT_1788354 [Coprinellus micaceus]|uniref:Velvet domain-containing protein n=1 Tax=Coprinellus micaceus TaxID=71717 RepID=A0A4Y7TNM1_COPMI|nr:hypothetical protein FA13DRAFT_1788354 [Coprinellus micaceus]
MIQHARPPRPQSRSSVPPPPGTDGPEVWGQWSGRRHYSLEIVQNPLRARMCGFGDKDRRPLAPAAVAKMIVRREDNTVVDVDDVDVSFFLVTVDLWSADGKQEMNLVLHPSTAERYVPPNPPSKPPRRRNTSTSQQKSGTKTPVGSSTPTPAQTPNSGQNYYTPQAPTQEGPNPYPQDGSSEVVPTWGYPPPAPIERTASYPPTVLPSISSFGRNPPASNTEPWPSVSSQDTGSYAIDPSLRSSSGSDSRENSEPSNYGANTYPASYSNASPYAQDATETSQSSLRQPANYTRTLVGPLSANACRLLDEHRKEGIFFLFQDLSVRTEGTFRLRMRLMNVGASPAPESGAIRVHNNVSPVLAQTFTDSFTVYSAKRFPGVPDTTALSIAFGNQGQKLPLRNRHGTGSKRRRRGDGSGSDEDSDDS